MAGIDHVQLKFSSETIDEAVKAYTAAIAPLGLKELMRFKSSDKAPLVVGLGTDTPMPSPFFWLAEVCPTTGSAPNTGVHFAFKAENRAQVDAFYKAALEAGFKCNGEPGLRPQYHENFYAAFVTDLAGNNIEAVCHTPVA
ncbi:hypothetical protein FRB99_001139 [Tulasnella sp. 403]|nr:hypothetical protein FRB99_001139 [Tulasnella sp. 403]